LRSPASALAASLVLLAGTLASAQPEAPPANPASTAPAAPTNPNPNPNPAPAPAPTDGTSGTPGTTAPAVPPPPPKPLDPALVQRANLITGRGFERVQFPIAPVNGTIRFAAARVYSWHEDSPGGLGAGSLEGPTQRIVLDGEVRARLGAFEFVSQRAVVFLQRVPDSALGRSAGGNATPTYQVFAYFDRIGSPTSEAGVSMTADRLPVRGVITAANGIELRADALLPRAPDAKELGANKLGPLVSDAERELADYLRTTLGLPTSKEQEAAKRAEEIEALRRARDAKSSQQLPAAKPRAEGQGPRRFIAGRDKPIRPAPLPEETPDGLPPDERIARAEPRGEGPSPIPQHERPAARPDGRPITPTKPVPPGVETPGERTQPRPGQETPGVTRPVPPTTTPPTTTPPTTTPPTTSPPTGTRTAGAQPPTTDLRRVKPATGTPIFSSEGTITIAPGEVQFVSSPEENSIIASSGVVVQYLDTERQRSLELSAQRVVVFLDPGPLEQVARLTIDNVRGMYLEGDVVASDGRYTLRGPRVYYDIRKNKAYLVDAVFWTFDEARRLPLYVRAKALRQESSEHFEAAGARLSTTAFFEPELEIGASNVVVTREPRVATADGAGGAGGGGSGGGGTGGTGTGPFGMGGSGSGGTGSGGIGDADSRTIVQARDVTMRSGDVPFFYWPGFTGDPDQFPLKDIRIDNSSGSGAALKLTWDAAVLLGFKRDQDASFDLRTDAYFDRGIGVGSRGEWISERSRGEYFAYILPDDTGTDLLKSGAKRDAEGDTRGMFVFEERLRLDDRWTVLAEGAYISDENFVDAFFERMGETRREFANRLALTRREDNTLLTMQAKTTFNDFVANEYILESQGYTTSKLPEISHYVINQDLFPDTAPGALSWFSEMRLGRLELNFDEIQARDRGIRGNAQALKVFGILPTQTLADSLRAQGYQEEGVWRFDTRQELTSQLAAGPVNITPFVVGRVTAYDSDFSSISPESDENVRLWAAAGTKFSTTVTRIDDSVQSRFFDLNRIRHIVEPHVTLWSAATSLDSENLPIYDDSVEGITEGSQARLGVSQVWQTKRGGKGREYTADVFKLDTDVVFASGEGDRGSPVRRFIDYRPELSESGNFFVADATWKATDALSVVGSETFDFDLGQSARTSGGLTLDHGYGLTSFVEARFLNSQDTTFIDFGGSYELTTKYRVGAVVSYDTTQSDFQSVNTSLERRSAAFLFGFDLGYNTITGETSFGFLLRPIGASGGVGARGIGSSDPAQQGSLFGG
jgi:hypothetical protein